MKTDNDRAQAHIEATARQIATDEAVLGIKVPAVSSLPERDPSKPAEAQGLFRKFDVRRVDGSDAPGGKHHGCEYFVLDVAHDQHAPAALRAYGEACKDTHPQLSADLRALLASRPSAQADAVSKRNLMRAKTLLVYLWRMHDSGGISMGRSRENVLLETVQWLLGEPDAFDLSKDEGENVGEARDWISQMRREKYAAPTAQPQADGGTK